MNLFIYGAGGLGREVLHLARTVEKWDSITFIDDNARQNSHLLGIPLINYDSIGQRILELNNQVENYFVIAVGEPHLRAILFDKVLTLDVLKPITLIHPNTYVASNAKIGSGVIINYGSFLSDSIEIHENSYLQPYAVVGHDCIVRKNSVISTFVSIGGNCRIGSEVFIGMNASLIQNITIGNNSIIGMGSVVQRPVEEGLVVVGNPARAIRKNENRKVFGNQ